MKVNCSIQCACRLVALEQARRSLLEALTSFAGEHHKSVALEDLTVSYSVTNLGNLDSHILSIKVCWVCIHYVWVSQSNNWEYYRENWYRIQTCHSYILTIWIHIYEWYIYMSYIYIYIIQSTSHTTKIPPAFNFWLMKTFHSNPAISMLKYFTIGKSEKYYIAMPIWKDKSSILLFANNPNFSKILCCLCAIDLHILTLGTKVLDWKCYSVPRLQR